LIDENGARLGATNIETTSGSSLTLHSSTFDKVLVDAPCSNTGVLRRRVDLRWRITPEEIARLCRTQLELLKQASRAVRPGGVLVYSTCSLEPEENSEVVKQFLAEVSGFALERERMLTPCADGVDGAFVARLRRA
jgi:16S rRNA (cytosine967-C5)-methyltransferase